MIEQSVKIHDNYSIEMKFGFRGHSEVKMDNFWANIWLFVPSSLDINRFTYPKEQFYRDLRTNVRLITPVYSLADIASGTNSPIAAMERIVANVEKISEDVQQKELEYQFKMFNSILKSALRGAVKKILSSSKQLNAEAVIALIDSYISYIKEITIRFRKLEVHLCLPKVKEYFCFADEFMSVLIELHYFKLLEGLKDVSSILIDKLQLAIRQEMEYKSARGYLRVEEHSKDANRAVILRRGILKKYSESELFLRTSKKEDGFIVRQVIYSLAAGISMVFATIIAFYYQLTYGNFTLPLFIALVIGYMFKDRIKELSRFYFAHQLNSRYFDLKTIVRIGADVIGVRKEGFDYIKKNKVPAEVLAKRNKSPLLAADDIYNSEKIILYRTHMRIYNSVLKKHSPYKIDGLNNILRLNVESFLKKMDNPEVSLFHLQDDNSNFICVNGEKIYYLNMVLQLVDNTKTPSYEHYRIMFNRDGIKDINHLSVV